jgi:hypothetical protein
LSCGPATRWLGHCVDAEDWPNGHEAAATNLENK